ncbi:MAG: DNA polymerase III subunit [Pirellulaceae bacterium]
MWHSIRGHDRVIQQFRTALSRGRLASTFLFVGPPGVGKRTFAHKLAQGLLCDTRPEAALDPCGRCPACQQVDAETHPDVHVVQRPADASNLPLELFIGDDEHRMRAGLCYELSLKPFSGKRRIGIIDDADLLALGSRESANSLLKTLEEPPPKSVLILIGTSQQRQLPTIRSRCQIVRFDPLADADVSDLLQSEGICTDKALAEQAARFAGGSLQRAAMWCDEAVLEFRQNLLEQLSRQEFEQLALAKMAQQFVDAAGKEAPAKRARMRDAAQMAAEFYRGRMRAAAEGGANAEPAASCQELCLDAIGHVDANVNLTTLIEWWVDELATMSRCAAAR